MGILLFSKGGVKSASTPFILVAGALLASFATSGLHRARWLAADQHVDAVAGDEPFA
jgi:hypothetical protein